MSESDSPVLAVGDDSFAREVLESSTPVLVDFWAPWCVPCKGLFLVLEEVAKELGSRLRVVKLDIDENPDTPQRFGVRGIPTLLLFQHGEVVASRVGSSDKSQLMSWLASVL